MKTNHKGPVFFVQFGQHLIKLIFISTVLVLALSACTGKNPQLVYRAGGTAANAVVTYVDGEGNPQEVTTSLPWETTIEIGADEFNFQLTVANAASDGDVSCEVVLNEESMMDAASSQAYIDCSGDVTKKGSNISYHISTHPVEAYLNTAQEMYDDGDYDQALAEIDKAIQIAPNFAGAYFMQGLTQNKLGDVDKALGAYTQAITLDPKYVKAINNRGLVYEKMGDLDAAITDWTTAIEIDPEIVNSYYNRARAYFTQGNYEAAKADALKVQELSDDPEMLEWAEGALDQLAALLEKPEPTEPAPTEVPTEQAPEPVATEEPAITGPSAGQWILFTSITDKQRVIYALNIDNGEIDSLTPDTSFNWDATLSLDGNLIAFVSAIDGNPEIYVMSFEGRNPIRLTNDPGPDYSPVWSPDGNLIAFVTDRNGNADIYTINADGEETQITDDEAHDWYPTWNADGTEIAFVSERDGDAEIYVYNIDGSIRQVTDNTIYDADPCWSPNGRLIAFSSSTDGEQADIFIINPDGTDLQQVTSGPANDIQPSWSFDSNYLLFSSNRDTSTMEIYMMIESGDTVRLTNNDVEDRFPGWGPLFTP